MTDITIPPALSSVYDALACRVPPMDPGDGLRIDEFEVVKDSLENLRLMLDGGGRHCIPGTYRKLMMDGRLWMSDTTAERRDHYEPVYQARRHPGGRGLVGGLGLGCVVGAMLDVLDHVDVVELDPRVVEHVGAWFTAEYGNRVTVHHDDMLTIKWPKGTYWDVAWYDIWPEITSDNLEGMKALHRSYGRRVGWQGSWARKLIEADIRRENRSGRIGYW